MGLLPSKDALEKVWDLVVPGGIVVIDDFFHKVQGPARLLADQTGCRSGVPLFHPSSVLWLLLVRPGAPSSVILLMVGRFGN